MDVLSANRESLALLRNRNRVVQNKIVLSQKNQDDSTQLVRVDEVATVITKSSAKVTGEITRKPLQPLKKALNKESISLNADSQQPVSIGKPTLQDKEGEKDLTMGLNCAKLNQLDDDSSRKDSVTKETKKVVKKVERLSVTPHGRQKVTSTPTAVKTNGFTLPKTLSATPLNRPMSTACQTLEDVARYIIQNQVQNIVVMVGAGISTLSGIPDFRSPGTGLYDNLQQYKIPYPEAIFDIDYFQRNQKPFFTLAKELYPSGRWRPGVAHYFLKLLFEKNLLLRIYTQNIDGLERVAGIPPEKLVEAHGTFATATCQRCDQRFAGVTVKDAVDRGQIPRCTSTSCQGVIKPDIVFFGEDLPRKFWNYLYDFPQADLLLVMGTSLEVEPFASIVDATRIHIPRVLFNREPVGVFRTKRRIGDVVAQGDLKCSIETFAGLLNWKEELSELMCTWEEESRSKEFVFGNRTPAVKSATTFLQRARNSPAYRAPSTSSSTSSRPVAPPNRRPRPNGFPTGRLPNIRSNGVQINRLSVNHARGNGHRRKRMVSDEDTSSSSDDTSSSEEESSDSDSSN